MRKFTKADIGCYIDGAFGSDHRREILAGFAEEFGNKALAEELRGEESDDLSEEQDAIALLQDHTAEGVYWVEYGGDLLLTDERED